MATPLSVGQAKEQLSQAVAAETAANNAYTDALNQKNATKKAWIAAGGQPGTPEAAAYKDASNNFNSASAARDEAAATVAEAEQNVTDAQKTTDDASSKTAADAVANTNTETPPPPATQNTGTDASPTGTALTDEERVLVAVGEDQAPPGEASGPIQAVTPPAINPTTNEDSKTFVPKASPPVQVGGPKGQNRFLSNNPLSDYPSYTYNLHWHILTKDDYHNLINNPGGSFKPSKNLVSTGNKYNKTTGSGTLRDPAFTDDFYFDSLKMTTVVGLNAQTRGTNAITVSFTIIEPYGMTLLDRILDIANNEIGAKNYLENPYLLEINFVGYDDEGNAINLPEHTKYLPIKLVGFKIKASTKGAEYAVEAVPFNHQAQFESVEAIKARFEVSAKTVKDYFANTIDAETMANVKTQIDTIRSREEAANKKPEDKDPRPTKTKEPAAGEQNGVNEIEYDAMGNPTGTRTPNNATGDSKKTKPEPPPTIKTKSFTGAYNAWNLAAQKNGNVEFADQILFEIDPAIADAPIVDKKKNDVKKTPPKDAKNTAKANENKKDTPADTIDLSGVIHSLDPGTTVSSVINLVIPQSKFFTDQIIDASTQSSTKTGTSGDSTDKTQSSKPFYMFKIIPKVHLGDFDRERGTWGKIITYYIKKYKVYNNRDDRVPKSDPPAASKNYEYMYTGHNTDVINFDIDFNTLYFTAINIDKGKTEATNKAQLVQDTKLKDGKQEVDTNQLATERREMIAGSHATNAGGATTRSETVNASSVMQSLYTSAAGDMVNLKLQILGDPEFIKQDDIYVSPDPDNWDEDNQYVNGTQSLNMDNGEVYCNVTFKTPRDFDAETGQYLQTSGKYSVSGFSGFYRILKVESEFRGGKFTQTLEMIRYPNQPTPLPATGAGAGQSSPAFAKTDPRRLDIPTKTTNSDVSKADIARAPDAVTPPVAVKRIDDDATFPPPTTAVASDENVSEPDLAAVVAQGETKDIADATSADGNTTPVQAVDVRADSDLKEKQQASVEVQGLKNENATLLSSTNSLSAQNKTLSEQRDQLEADLAAKDPNYDNLSWSQIQSKYPEVAALSSQMTQNRAQINENTAKMKANADQAIQVASKNSLGLSITYESTINGSIPTIS